MGVPLYLNINNFMSTRDLQLLQEAYQLVYEKKRRKKRRRKAKTKEVVYGRPGGYYGYGYGHDHYAGDNDGDGGSGE